MNKEIKLDDLMRIPSCDVSMDDIEAIRVSDEDVNALLESRMYGMLGIGMIAE